MKRYEPRDRMVEYFRSVVEGPKDGDTELVEGTPFLRYMTGMLFSRGVALEETSNTVTATAEDESSAEDRAEDSSGKSDSSVQLSGESLPSAVGLSLKVTDSERLRCKAWAARYIQQDSAGRSGRAGGRWLREPLATEEKPDVCVLTKQAPTASVLGGRASLTAKWRTQRDGTAIVTVALVNEQDSDKKGADVSTTLFQVGLRCEPMDGHVLPYPEAGAEHAEGSEEAEIELLYAKVHPFARGHGAAASWGLDSSGCCGRVEVDFVPAVDVPQATFELSATDLDPSYCSLAFLTTAPRLQVVRALQTLSDAYGAWVEEQRKQAQLHPRPHVATRFVQRAGDWHRRIESGTKRIADDEVAWTCFRMANEAMGKQMILGKNRPKVPFSRTYGRSCPPLELTDESWRPFQIAFMLATIDSLMDEESPDRSAVDVIWFPTGGGKTEAYLLVCAFELIRRRLVHGGRDTATAIFSRYTMRFLTAQQFQRTAALVIALELMRRAHQPLLGDRPFTLGLWVGDLTPNSYRKAHDLFEKALEQAAPTNPFLLQACPCCGTDLFPSATGKKGKKKSRGDFGVEARVDAFRFRCVSQKCEFASGLPLEVVDDALYDRPPSILLGTIDKFAILPWSHKARVFFGGKDDQSVPPSLILQDELHLISGPLGSLAAPYDAAVDAIISLRGGASKRIASTATIRNATEQVQGLYGRRAFVFPAACGDWDNAFFFSTNRDLPGRTYVGVMGQGYIKPVVAMAWASAALLQSVNEVPLDTAPLDGYWTLLAYHNSRRELGRTMTAARDEVQARIKAIASSPAVARELGEPFELSAQMVKSMGEAMEALEKPHTTDGPAIDIVPCTSIISVGVDLPRLALMIVNGQPKLTSEYIQATSRVGRGAVPGLVVSLLSATKPRDRSHYEDFRAFHDSIYRHVEPTSVTPYALPARERTLHAALIALIRHGTQFSGNEQARFVDFDNEVVKNAILCLTNIMCSSDETEEEEIRGLMSSRIAQWREIAESGLDLLFERRMAGHQFKSLLAEYGKSQSGASWPTMMSVRNVDPEVRIKIK